MFQISKSIAPEFIAVKVSQDLNFDVKYVNTVEQMFGTNWLQKTIKYQTNKQNTKYSNWNMEKQSYICTNTALNYIKQARHN